MNRQEFEAKIIAKAWRDAAFRAKLEADPKAVVAEELSALKGAGVKLPDTFKVTVVHETPDQMYLVIPPNPEDVHNVSLSDEQLLAVAGGAGQMTVSSTLSTTVGVNVQVTGPTLDTVAVVQIQDPVIVLNTPTSLAVIC